VLVTLEENIKIMNVQTHYKQRCMYTAGLHTTVLQFFSLKNNATEFYSWKA